ncbi:Uncharacterised protein [Dorea longicatena]|nr:Uncharacterised protein [Dorea longicatena]
MRLKDRQMIRMGQAIILIGIIIMFLPVQMASAYIGTCLMPPLFGLIANHISIRLLPLYLLILLILMVYMHELLELKTRSTAI